MIRSVAALAIIRHGETEWTAARRLQGRSDVGLSAAGRESVARWRLPDDVIGWSWHTSPLRRCQETAALLRRTHPGAGPPQSEPRLIEMSFGSWEGRTLSDLRAEYGPTMAELERQGLDFRAPGGESPRDLQDRLKPWLADLADADRPILAISHKGVIRALYALASGWDMRGKPPQRLAYDGLHRFAVDRHGIRIVALNQRLRRVAPASEEGA